MQRPPLPPPPPRMNAVEPVQPHPRTLSPLSLSFQQNLLPILVLHCLSVHSCNLWELLATVWAVADGRGREGAGAPPVTALVSATGWHAEDSFAFE